jgi:hypothetical protein
MKRRIQAPLSLRVDTDPDPNFHFDADPDQDPDRHSNDADPHVDTTQVLHMLEYQFFFTFSHSISSLQCITFLINVKDVTISIILYSILKFPGNK